MSVTTRPIITLLKGIIVTQVAAACFLHVANHLMDLRITLIIIALFVGLILGTVAHLTRHSTSHTTTVTAFVLYAPICAALYFHTTSEELSSILSGSAIEYLPIAYFIAMYYAVIALPILLGAAYFLERWTRRPSNRCKNRRSSRDGNSRPGQAGNRIPYKNGYSLPLLPHDDAREQE